MSQNAAGTNLSRQDSFGVSATVTAASAFGDDLADISYSIPELSQYKEDKSKKHGKHKEEAFIKTIYLNIDRQESSVHDQEENGEHTTGQLQSSGGSPDQSDSGDSEETDLTVTTFSSFAQSRFVMKASPVYSCTALTHPLLPKDDKADYLASLASWVTILRIMGDIPDDAADKLVVTGSKSPIPSKLRSYFKTKYSKKDVDDAHRKYSDLFKDPTGTDTKSLPFLSGMTDTILEKVQLLCAMGIYRPSLRDELYCQLCKQLSNNPSKNSIVRGWVLMYMFAGSFAPTESLAPSLNSFLSEGPPEISDKIDWMLRRTCSVGTRTYPPSWLEFQAAKNGKPVLVPISLMNGHRMLCEVDAAMTVSEVIRNIGERLGMNELTGFSLYISLHTKISCLGNSQHRILDAISESETFSKQMGIRENNAIWRIFFRLEYFSSWHNPEEDDAVSELVFQQIRRGIKMSEYRLENDELLLNTAAKVYCLEHADDVGHLKLEAFVNSFIPDSLLEKRPKDFFPSKVKASFYNLKLEKERLSASTIKAEIITLGKDNFDILFSRYYDVSKVVSFNQQLTEVVVGVNHKGIFVVDSTDKLKLHLDFAEIVNIVKAKHSLTLGVAQQESVVFSTNHSDDFNNLVSTFIEELTKRSTTAIAREDFTQLDGPQDANIIKGDILEMNQSVSELVGNETVTVLCQRTHKPCDIPVNLCYVVATVKPLPEDVMMRLVSHLRKGTTGNNIMEPKQQPNLQQYAKSHFRPSNENSVSKLLSKASLKKKDSEALWSYSKDGLKKPLLKLPPLQTYMSNLVCNDEVSNYVLCSEWILNPARRNKFLRDEIYCQIIKQLTNNNDKVQTDRGWSVLTLLTSICPPSHELYEHVRAFLKASTHPLSTICESNLQLKKKRGGCRLYSSHFLEHEMVIKQLPNVRIQLFLPNQTTQTLEVTSHTKIFDIKKSITTRLKLSSSSEYSLFFSCGDKVNCLSDRAFYFDCLSHAEVYWFKQGKRSSYSVTKNQPLLVMLKKIWVNGQPGTDPVADQIFHYSQEMPNYLRGYHNIPEDLIIKLAALVYRAQFGSETKHFSKPSALINLIIPKHFLTGKDLDSVMKDVEKQYQADVTLSQQEARSTFLQYLSQLNTYGSVFFEVKQRVVAHLPKVCLIAMNYSGVHIIETENKIVVKSYNYDQIPNWAYDEHSFTLIVVEGSSTNKILLETKVGHNMDDLLMSYVGWIMNYQMRKKHGYLGDQAGESIV
ncbi:myosin-VIIa [Biomphalaria pfeifferi]|uniref:Myosin-VIIa n=1 Tax=Biomphalaria pfeifferi TaxID=112525 RepID=A0AAD8C6Z8_BIOPF|nr:myosin-VIIa [Biomphalaria pfeifferi]